MLKIKNDQLRNKYYHMKEVIEIILHTIAYLHVLNQIKISMDEDILEIKLLEMLFVNNN